MSIAYEPYELESIDFVGGQTRELGFNLYYLTSAKLFSLSGCTANFAVVNFINRKGTTILTKAMEVSLNAEGTVDNKLIVTLDAKDTVDLEGKYLYQITIKDADGSVEIPGQGSFYITNNINKVAITN